MKRKKTNYRKDKRIFSNTASYTNKRNLARPNPTQLRGGHRI